MQSRRMLSFLVPFVATFFTAVARAAEVAVTEGIVYAVHGGEELKLDLALPADEAANGAAALRPAVLCIHGGAWRGGGRQIYAGFIRRLAERGYVAATMSYRFAPKHPWPAQLEDVEAALAWLRRNASKYRIDPHRLGATGGSAGGHLSLFLGLKDDVPGGRLQAVVNYFGPTDLRTDVFSDEVDAILEDLAGGPRQEKAALYEAFSPILQVSAGDAAVLTFHGTRDPLVPVGQASALHEALAAARIPHRLEILEGRGHGWGGEDLERTQKETLAFLDAYLRPDLPLLLAEDFSSGAGRWEPMDPAIWRVEEKEGRHFYSLASKKTVYKTQVRSPFLISLLSDTEVGDFVLDVRLQSTVADYGHRDLCIFFGHQGPSRFYYAHLGKKADPHAHSIFLVNDKDRVSIASRRTGGIDWDDGWHRVRVKREVSSGRIEVFFDDMLEPVMSAEDRTFLGGRIGLGSFDDTGNFTEVRLYGRKLAESY